MKQILTLVVLMFALAVSGQAQKLDPQLTELVPRPTNSRRAKVQAQPRTHSADELRQLQQYMNITLGDDGSLQRLSVIARLRPGAADPTAQLQQLGIRVVNIIGRLAILDVPADKLYELERVEAIQRADADRAMQLTNDQARLATQVNTLNGEAPELFAETELPSASTMPFGHTSPTDLDYYTGKGVVAGVVDTGVEFNHAAFRDAAGNQRMKAAFVPQSLMGQEGSDIVAVTGDDIRDLTTDQTNESHGSHTTATMAGTPISLDVNGTTIDLRGMAPDADLVVGALPQLYHSHIISSLQQIYQYAQQHQQPAVVNLSLGSLGGFYDGSDRLASSIDFLTDGGTQPGRIAVISASNYACDSLTIVKTLDATDGVQLKTILSPYEGKTYYRKLGFSFYLRDKSPFEVEFKAVDITTGKTYDLTDNGEDYDLTKEVHIIEMPENSEDGDARLFVFPTELLTDGTDYLYYYGNSNTLYFADYTRYGQETEFKSSNLRLAIFIKGAPVGSELVMQQIGHLSQHFIADPLPDAGYTPGDGSLSLNVSAVTDGAICVGAYNTRTTIYHMTTGQTGFTMQPMGQASYFSSYGTDDYGIDRPDVLAPGHFIYSAYNYYDTTAANQGNENGGYASQLVGKTELTFGEHPFYFGYMQGTSQAAPCVSGIIALWLQANPNLCTNDVRRIIRLTADHDQFTDQEMNTPNEDLRQTGMGKINALKGMQLIAYEAQNRLSLANAAANTAAIETAANEQIYVSVTLQDRTFYKDESWNTLCLPFDLNLNESPLAGLDMKVMELDPDLSSLDTDGTLTLHFTPVDHTLRAGKPYLIKWACLADDAEDYAAHADLYDLSNPVFRFVCVTNTEPIPVTTSDGTVSFVGTYDPVSIPAGGDPTKLYLGSDDQLYWPSATMTIGCQRAYFQLNNGLIAGDPESSQANIRNIVLNFGDETEGEVTAIRSLSESQQTFHRLSDEWYTLTGVRLSGRPVVPGLYLHGDRRVYVQ